MSTINLHCIICQNPFSFTTMREDPIDMTFNHCAICHVYYGQWYPSLKVDWVQYCYEGDVYDNYLVIDYAKNYTEIKVVYAGEALQAKTVLTLPITFPLMSQAEAHKMVDRLKNLKAFL
jgi:hypothetical protein